MVDHDETAPRVRTSDVEDLLAGLLEQVREAAGDDDAFGEIAASFGGIEGVASFRDAGVMTRDRGVVLRCADGSEFQITIVRSD